tara:strand:- start:16492 stop:16707 length:216 start_codon:yes stop_codon:yes gene_type:complete
MSERSIMEQISDGDKTLIVMDAVPKGSVGVTIVFGEHQTHGSLDIKRHKELLLHITDVLIAERDIIENGDE